MNDRIKALAELAWDAREVSTNYGYPVSFAEKFAKLIMQDCIWAVRTNYVSRATTEAVIAIEKHFGVER